MAESHLGHNWYLYEMDDEITDWILECLSENMDFVQPYDSISLRAKQTLTGKKIYKVVFSAQLDGYNFPVCYMLDLNTGKFKGNKMHYCIDNEGTHYSDKYPVYCDRFKFDEESKYRKEQRQLKLFLDGLEIPDALPSSKERRYAYKKAKKDRRRNRQQHTNLPHWRVGHEGRKKKKGNLLKDLILV